MKFTALFAITVLCLAGCRPAPKTPDQIRQDTASATAKAAQDTKAVAQGIYDGLRQHGPVNINHASKDQLEALPGIDAALAGKIIAGRPYKSSDELRRRHILSRAEYDRIAVKIKT